jgi:hypothetical protein
MLQGMLFIARCGTSRFSLHRPLELGQSALKEKPNETHFKNILTGLCEVGIIESIKGDRNGMLQIVGYNCFWVD